MCGQAGGCQRGDPLWCRPSPQPGRFLQPVSIPQQVLGTPLHLSVVHTYKVPPPLPLHPNISPVRLCFLYIIFLNFNFLIFFFLQLLKKLHGKNNSLYDTYTQSGVILYIIKDENSHFP